MVYFTTDGKREWELSCGITPPLFGTVDFSPADDMEEILARFRKHQSKGPLVNSELYSGWCDWYGQPHQTTRKLLTILQYILFENAELQHEHRFSEMFYCNWSFIIAVSCSLSVSILSSVSRLLIDLPNNPHLCNKSLTSLNFQLLNH